MTSSTDIAWMLYGLAVLICINGSITRLINAYDRRTDQMRRTGSEDPQGTGGVK